MQQSILFFGFFCDGDTHDIDMWDKLSGIHIEQKWKKIKVKFIMPDRVEMANHVLGRM